LVPSGIEAESGLTVIDVNTAAVTVRLVDPVTAPIVAVISAVPCPTVVTSPVVFPIVATVSVSELHCTVLVITCVLPSLYVPVAVNCCVVPKAIDGEAGVMAMDTNVAVVIVSVVDPVTDPELALIVVVPCDIPVANPTVPAALLIVATVVALEVHWTVLVMFCVLASVYVPVAVN